MLHELGPAINLDRAKRERQGFLEGSQELGSRCASCLVVHLGVGVLGERVPGLEVLGVISDTTLLPKNGSR